MASDIYEDTIYGQILPVDWNNDAVTGLILLVDGEEEFIIENDDNGERLTDHIDKWVTAQGIVEETDDEYRIRIRNFKVDDELDYDNDDKW
ncbi:hypothetical protein SYK_14220 [Pseudodesulfovibrio nedwellii]|uniref:Uncharacterized protein n=1 Tax=Pseudodesulfovibrio nedwellii TaxID=2973072 RepID=A0ABM8B048_9BACT|nr:MULTISPECIES: hypothetical protein [Pseudodesulfovibrio]BDQ37062.1 hypothetical protein SYK_14220 [Pseudodesulfovibrio nedwellii]